MRRFTKLGSVLVGIGAGAVAIAWLVKDRLLGPESAPVGVEDAPAFRVAPTDTPNERIAGSDDLSEVKGIGPVYRARLEQAGITTFEALVAAGEQAVADASEVTPERARDWISQAATLAG